ncbi:MAG: hypothetical protein ACRCW2_01660 [Cellulosilyticaceae bacterium]
MEILISEFKRGSKVYIGETLSVFALALFFVFLPKMTGLVASGIGGKIVLAWFVINAAIVAVYSIVDFVKMMLEGVVLERSFTQSMIFKVMFFGIFFGTNMFILIIGSSIAVPILALMGTYLVLAMTKVYFNKKVPYVCLGILWFMTLLVVSYVSYRMLYMMLFAVISNQMVVSLLGTLVYFGLTFFIFILLLKKLNKKNYEVREGA